MQGMFKNGIQKNICLTDSSWQWMHVDVQIVLVY
jgi:hypothetical protein